MSNLPRRYVLRPFSPAKPGSSPESGSKLKTQASFLFPGCSDEVLRSILYDLSGQDLSCLSKVYRLYLFIKSRIYRLSLYWADFYGPEYINSQYGIRFTQCISHLESLLAQLDINSVISQAVYLKVYREFKSLPPNVKEHCILLFNDYKEVEKDAFRSHTDRLRNSLEGFTGSSRDIVSRFIEHRDFDSESVSVLFDNLRTASICGRRSELERRLIAEIAHRIGVQNWFCIFNTLTVSPEHYSEVFSEGASAWQGYLRKCDALFGRAAHGSYSEAKRRRSKGDEFHSYFAVVERGGKSGRLHIHVLHFFAELPNTFSDPNCGRSVPLQRQVEALRYCWNFGFSTPIAVRFSNDDAFGKAGWLWPVKCVDGVNVPIVGKPYIALARYMAKYLQKAYDPDIVKEDDYQWRTRLSRNLGLQKCREYVQKLSPEMMIKYLQLRGRILYQDLVLPKRLLFRCALRKWSESLKLFYQSLVSERLVMWKPLPSIWNAVQNMFGKKLCPSDVNFGSIKTGLTLAMDVCSKPFYAVGGVCHAV